jgi:hypothetical protein
MALEPGGTIWIMANNALYYWDGKQFRPPQSAPLKSGQYLTCLYGGPDRGIYATQPGDQEHHGKLYRLSDGDARYLTDFYYEETGRSPALYVSKSGTLYNWGNRFLAIYAGGEWKRIEASLDLEYALVLDTGDSVHFYYNGKLYSADAHANLTERHLPAPISNLPGQRRVHGALWGDAKMIILESSKPRLYAYNLRTCEAVSTNTINAALGQRPVHDLFRAGDGSVWVLASDPEGGYLFWRISPGGQAEAVAQTSKLGWENLRCWQYPHSVLTASDGSIWFGLSPGGIARYKHGSLRIFTWKDGLIGGASCLCEGPEGRVYALSGGGVCAFLPDQPPIPLPPELALWEEYELASYQPLRDGKGQVWMALKDHPRHLSCWDGYEWTHIRVPFDTTQVGRALTDDRGHLLVQMAAYPDRCYDVGPDDLKRYDDLQSLLVGVARNGAKRFFTGPDFQGCYLLPGGRIWFGYYNYNTFQYFDGQRWDSLHMNDDVYAMYETPKLGILIRTQGGKYYTYDRGQLLQVEVPHAEGTRWLLGPKGLQPYEESLLTAYPELYAAVEQDRDGHYRLLYPTPQPPADQSAEPAYAPGDSLPQYTRTLTPACFGGLWTDYGAGAPYRLFAGKVLECDLDDSPLQGMGHDIRSVIEDRAHNLWLDAGWYRGARHVFVKRLHDCRLNTTDVPQEVKRSVRITAEPTLPGLNPSRLRLCWRLNTGPWRIGDPGQAITLRFFTPGEYHLELMGLDQHGATTQIATLVVNATVPLPDTRLVEAGPYTVKDVVWKALVEPVPCEVGNQPTLVYRIDGGEWQAARDDNRIPLGGLQPGSHMVEIAAQEDEAYRDPTPLHLDLYYDPDFQFIVQSRLEALSCGDPARAQQALQEIRMAGPQVIPILERTLSGAREAAALVRPLEQLIRELAPQSPN